MQKIIPVLLIFFGESLAIYSEIMAARNIGSFNSTFWKMLALMIIAVSFLLLGYMLGIKYLQNIWVVSVISITSIIIMEPIITYFLFHSFPEKGALLGMIFGILGLLSTLFIK